MKTVILIFTLLSTLSLAQVNSTVNTTVSSSLQFCDNLACLNPSLVPSSPLYASTAYYMKLTITDPAYQNYFVRVTQVNQTGGFLSLSQASNSTVLSNLKAGQILFNLTFPITSSSVVMNIQGILYSTPSRMLQTGGFLLVNATSSSVAFVAASSGQSSTQTTTAKNGQMIIASFMLVAILLL